MVYKDLRCRIWEIVEVAKDNDRQSRSFDIFILLLITANVFAVIFGTIPFADKNYRTFLSYFEFFSVLIFSLEYIIRLWTCIENERFQSPILGRIKYIFTFMPIVDMLAILPFFLTFGGLDLRFIRGLRLFRIFRLAKVGRYYGSLNLIRNVIVTRKEELILSVFMMLMLLLISSSIMYFAENTVQPDAFSSIPASAWWAVAALTTVGYGDVYPITAIGKLMGSLIAMIGVGMFALPTGILASGFVEEIENSRESKKDDSVTYTCSNCGKEVNIRSESE